MASATTINQRLPAVARCIALLALVLSTVISTHAVADESDRTHVFMTKQEALEQVAFPDADRIERKTLFLNASEQQALSARARSKFESQLYTLYVGHRDNEIVGYAVIDTDIVRSKAATYIAVLDPGGALRDIRILAWQEPPEYRPPQRWLDRFLGRELEDEDSLSVGRDVDAISGATLSVRMLTEHVRRTLALHDVLLDNQALVQR